MLTISKIKALAPRPKRYMVAAGGGLWIEIHPSGKMAWRSRYTLQGRPGKTNVGRWPQISLADARKRHQALLDGIAEGKSPTEVARAAQIARERGATVEEFAARYLTYVAKVRKNVEPIRRYFTRDVYPTLGKKPIASIGADDVRPLIFARCDAGHDQAALALRNLLKRLWDYAMVRGVTDKNPLHAIPAKYVAEASERKRALQPREIALFLAALDQSRENAELKAALRLILLTMTRKGEVRRARWEEFDFERAEWALPEAHSKGETPLVIPLSRQTVNLLREQRARHTRASVVFPMRDAVHTPLAPATLNKALARIEQAARIEHFSIHDLRRTAATNLAEQEFQSDWIEKSLNHKMKGVRGVYNRAAFLAQRREMLQKWADYLEQMTNGR